MLLILAVTALLTSSFVSTSSWAISAAAVPAVGGAEHAPQGELSTAGAKRSLKACGPLRSGNTHYVLENDVQSAGTCFSIAADHITLDLNGHSVIYGSSDGTKPTFGVLVADCWDTSITGNPCGGSHEHAVIMNGKIIQGASAAPMSHAIRFGQANNVTGLVIHDLDITVSAPDSIAIYTEYLPGGSDIYRNTIHNNVKVVSNRHQFRGMSIRMDEEGKAKLPDLVHENTIIGGAQSGIRVDNSAGTKIFANDVSQDATYTNGFCILAPGAHTEVYQNKCHPVHGRGIHTDASGVQIFDNVVETIDNNKNEEYGGCELNGTYGIQAESNGGAPEDIRIYHNKVKVHAAVCPAEAMRLTDLQGSGVDIYENTFIAVQDRIGPQLSNQPARGFSVGNVTGDHVVFKNNFVQADTSIFHMDWDSGGGINLKDNTFKAGVHGDATLLAEFINGASPSQDNVFQDNVMQGFPPTAVKFCDYSGDSWLVVGSSLTVHLKDQDGQAVADGEVRILGTSAKFENGLSDGQGNAKLLLPAFRIEYKQPMKKFSDYDLIVTREGCQTQRFSLTQPASLEVTRTLDCQTSGH
jgi:hypothetical protein